LTSNYQLYTVFNSFGLAFKEFCHYFSHRRQCRGISDHNKPTHQQVQLVDAGTYTVIKSRIVATGPVPTMAREVLSPFASIEVAASTDESSLISLVQDAIGLIVRGVTPISRRLIESGKELRVIGRTGAGYDNVDIGAATEHGIPVVFAPGAGTRAVAEGALLMLLALAKRLRELDHKTRVGRWAAREEVSIGDLYGATLGIAGLGRIGSQVSRLAQAFGMIVIAYDPCVNEKVAAANGAKLVSFDELLGTADFISLHAPLNEQTRGMIDAERLRLVKRGAVLINLARGGLMPDLDVLYQALESGTLSGLGLDVYPTEPPDTSHPIFRRADVLCTPHCMGLSSRAARATFTMVSEGMAEVFLGRVPNNVVDPRVFSASNSRHTALVSKVNS
jgi:D-3-phosphoglycerate dehydrogenase